MNWQSRLLRAFVVSALAPLLWSQAVHANGYLWRINTLSGMARFSDATAEQSWRTAAQGEILRSPFRVETGQDGHVVLVNDGDVVTVKANSRIEITGGVAGPLTKILQSIGNILYQVVPGMDRKFEVHTPYLVSVVKGTTFAVQVTKEFATISLIEGLVEVLATDDTNKLHKEEIHPGDVAIFGRGKTRIEVVEPSARVDEPEPPTEEQLQRLNEALQDLEPVAVEVIRLPQNLGRADTGTVDAGSEASVENVHAETAASVSEASTREERADGRGNRLVEDSHEPQGLKQVSDGVATDPGTPVLSPGESGRRVDEFLADNPGEGLREAGDDLNDQGEDLNDQGDDLDDRSEDLDDPGEGPDEQGKKNQNTGNARMRSSGSQR